jgi:hypothetical protein
MPAYPPAEIEYAIESAPVPPNPVPPATQDERTGKGGALAVQDTAASDRTPGGRDWVLQVCPFAVATAVPPAAVEVPTAVHAVVVTQETAASPATPAGTDWLVHVTPSAVARMAPEPDDVLPVATHQVVDTHETDARSATPAGTDWLVHVIPSAVARMVPEPDDVLPVATHQVVERHDTDVRSATPAGAEWLVQLVKSFAVLTINPPFSLDPTATQPVDDGHEMPCSRHAPDPMVRLDQPEAPSVSTTAPPDWTVPTAVQDLVALHDTPSRSTPGASDAACVHAAAPFVVVSTVPVPSPFVSSEPVAVHADALGHETPVSPDRPAGAGSGPHAAPPFAVESTVPVSVTIVHWLVDGHEIPVAAGSAGTVSGVQVFPAVLHASTPAKPEVVMPATKQAVDVGQVALVKRVLPGNNFALFQLAPPFEVVRRTAASAPDIPTAKQILADAHAAPSRNWILAGIVPGTQVEPPFGE